MLLSGTVQEIHRLLAEAKLSHRQIAASTGVARATVAAIAGGKRAECSRRHTEKEGDREEPRSPIGRCPSCGGRVYLPCRLCLVRAWQKERSQELGV